MRPVALGLAALLATMSAGWAQDEDSALCSTAQRASAGTLPAVVQACNQALQAQSTAAGQAKMLRYRGIALARGGSPSAAVADFDQVLQTTPDDTAALQGRAQTYEALGQRAQAAADYGRLAALRPGDTRWRIKVAALGGAAAQPSAAAGRRRPRRQLRPALVQALPAALRPRHHRPRPGRRRRRWCRRRRWLPRRRSRRAQGGDHRRGRGRRLRHRDQGSARHHAGGDQGLRQDPGEAADRGRSRPGAALSGHRPAAHRRHGGGDRRFRSGAGAHTRGYLGAARAGPRRTRPGPTAAGDRGLSPPAALRPGDTRWRIKIAQLGATPPTPSLAYHARTLPQPRRRSRPRPHATRAAATGGSCRAERGDAGPQAQASLRDLGYDVGAVNGRVGAKTRQAMDPFAADVGLPPGGEPDEGASCGRGRVRHRRELAAEEQRKLTMRAQQALLTSATTSATSTARSAPAPAAPAGMVEHPRPASDRG